MKWVLIGLIKIYRKFISPCIGPHCIYTPTCSQYAMEAIKKYGAIKGTYLASSCLFSSVISRKWIVIPSS